MRCPRCLEDVNKAIKRCQCGFAFDDVLSTDLPAWFLQVKQVLESSYTAAPTPWQQSGMSGTFEEWTRLRVPNLAAVNRPGKYLDIGCANGYLLECLVAWSQLKGIELTPYGIDYSVKLVALARERLSTYADHMYVGNAWNWSPSQRFDYVRTELNYVPRNYQKQFVERLIAKFVSKDGRLIISQYRNRRDNLTRGWIERDLVAWGFEVTEIHSGYSEDDLELCRVVVL
ncbi:class I SAM-dependent methyltransferase [Myxosarcina sp. GI1(2024)]